MKLSTAVSIIANDLTIIVNADSLGQIGAGKIENRASTFFIEEESTDLDDENLERGLGNFDSVYYYGSKARDLAVFIDGLRLSNNDIFRASDFSRPHLLVEKEPIRS